MPSVKHQPQSRCTSTRAVFFAIGLACSLAITTTGCANRSKVENPQATLQMPTSSETTAALVPVTGNVANPLPNLGALVQPPKVPVLLSMAVAPSPPCVTPFVLNLMKITPSWLASTAIANLAPC